MLTHFGPPQSASAPYSTTVLRSTCDFCRERKRKCSGGNPCTLCVKCKAPCSYTLALKRGPKRTRDAPAGAPDASQHGQQCGSGSSGGGSSSGDDDAPRKQQRSSAAALLLRGVAPHAGQLLGLRERQCLELFCLVHAGCGLVPGAQLERTAMRLMTYGRDGLGRVLAQHGGGGSGGDGGAQPRAARAEATARAANESMLWVATAVGSVLQSGGVADAQRFMLCASAALMACAEPAPQLLHAYCMMAWAHLLLESAREKPSFTGFYSCWRRALRVRRAMLDDAHAGLSLEATSEDTKLLIEVLRISQQFVDAYLASHGDARRAVEQQLGKDIHRQCLRDCEECGDSAPGTLYNCFAPGVEGLPLRVVAQGEGDGLETTQASAQAQGPLHRTAVQEALTQLGQPEVTGTDALVCTATRGFTRLTPVILSIDYRVVQVMRMVKAETAAARAGGALSPSRAVAARLRLIVEQLVSALGDEYLHRSSYNQLRLLYTAFFLRLVDGEEEDALKLLLIAARALTRAPGLIRYPLIRHNIHWVAAMLLSADRRDEHDALVRAYNALGLYSGGARDALPEAEDHKAQMCRCRHLRCAATHKVAAQRVAEGSARIFLRYTLRHLEEGAHPALDLTVHRSLPPSAHALRGAGALAPMTAAASPATSTGAHCGGEGPHACEQQLPQTEDAVTSVWGRGLQQSTRPAALLSLEGDATVLLPACATPAATAAAPPLPLHGVGLPPFSADVSLQQQQLFALSAAQLGRQAKRASAAPAAVAGQGGLTPPLLSPAQTPAAMALLFDAARSGSSGTDASGSAVASSSSRSSSRNSSSSSTAWLQDLGRAIRAAPQQRLPVAGMQASAPAAVPAAWPAALSDGSTASAASTTTLLCSDAHASSWSALPAFGGAAVPTSIGSEVAWLSTPADATSDSAGGGAGGAMRVHSFPTRSPSAYGGSSSSGGGGSVRGGPTPAGFMYGAATFDEPASADAEQRGSAFGLACAADAPFSPGSAYGAAAPWGGRHTLALRASPEPPRFWRGGAGEGGGQGWAQPGGWRGVDAHAQEGPPHRGGDEEGLDVDQELLARLAAELDDGALMELADACLPWESAPDVPPAAAAAWFPCGVP